MSIMVWKVLRRLPKPLLLVMSLFVLAAVAMVMCMGMAALVLDVGNWFRDKRRLQGTADAAALAGAQQLPNSPSGAQSLALDYANRNGGNVAGANITVSSTYYPNDTITVNGDEAHASGRKEDDIVLKDGQRLRLESKFSFTLKRGSRGWTIQEIQQDSTTPPRGTVPVDSGSRSGRRP